MVSLSLGAKETATPNFAVQIAPIDKAGEEKKEVRVQLQGTQCTISKSSHPCNCTLTPSSLSSSFGKTSVHGAAAKSSCV